ncbi:RidA family protein [Sphingomonas sp.]|uniref:RidA family protein n=1 Tax=Sphingomonas sp. TaxID=28214 RepID=UPI00286DD04A|nr:RidA family protein [Sphingomonas sp.]
MLRWLPFLLVATAATAAPAPPSPPLERIGTPSVNGARLPFSDAVRVGDVLFLSGAIGLGADGKLPAGIDAQARQTMDNIAAVLAKSGLGWGDVAKCTVMLDEIADWPAFNKVYASYFPTAEFPARSAFGADGLALGALVEVECIARAPAAK